MSKILFDLLDDVEQRDERRRFWHPRDGTEIDQPFVSANLTQGGFFLLVALFLGWACVLSLFVIDFQRTAALRPGALVVAGVAPLLGFVLTRSTSSVLSFAGFNIVVGGVAMLVGAGLGYFSPDAWPLARDSLRNGFICLVILGGIGLVLPTFFENFASAMICAMAAVAAGFGARVVLAFLGPPVMVEFVFAILATAFTAYQFWDHSDAHPTWDNAVDSAAGFYMAVIMFFGSLIAGRRR